MRRLLCARGSLRARFGLLGCGLTFRLSLRRRTALLFWPVRRTRCFGAWFGMWLSFRVRSALGSCLRTRRRRFSFHARVCLGLCRRRVLALRLRGCGFTGSILVRCLRTGCGWFSFRRRITWRLLLRKGIGPGRGCLSIRRSIGRASRAAGRLHPGIFELSGFGVAPIGGRP